MSVGKVFNPPPNWPAAPQGWQPPPGWQPDPGWGPPPDGWVLHTRVNPHPFLRSFAAGGAVYAVVLLLLALFTSGITSYAAGDLLATLVLMPGIATGLVLRSRRAYWPWWKVLLCLLAFALLFSVLRGLSDASDQN